MRHHVVYWKMARREVDVDDAELAALQRDERLHEVYIEFLDGQRLPLCWDVRTGRWDAQQPSRVREHAA
jgi:hypothetical protein